MKYNIAKQNAQQFANEKNKPVYITKADKLNDFQIVFSATDITQHYSVIEMIIPTTAEYLQGIVNREIEDAIGAMKSLPLYEINGQENYINASDAMDIIIGLRRLQKELN